MSAEDQSIPALRRSPLRVRAAHGGKLSDILEALAADETRERISVADLFKVMSHRAFGAMMFILAVPNTLPTPPGTSTLLGAPLIFIAAQLALNWPRPWLPKAIARRSMSRADFAKIVTRVAPWLARAERLLKPRLSILTYPPAEQAIGAICLLLAALLSLPIPLGNMLPALAICLFSLAILERDGVAALFGAATAVISLLVVWGVVFALIKSAIFVLRNALAG